MMKNKGFSLTELVIVVAVAGSIFTIGSQILIQVNRFVQLNRVRIDLQRDARVVFSLINRNLRQAGTNSISIDRHSSAQPPYSRIGFTKIDGRTYTFYQDGTKLIMSTQQGSRTLTEDVAYLAFTPPTSEDLSIISVSLTLEKAIYEGGTKSIHMASEKVQVMN